MVPIDIQSLPSQTSSRRTSHHSTNEGYQCDGISRNQVRGKNRKQDRRRASSPTADEPSTIGTDPEIERGTHDRLDPSKKYARKLRHKTKPDRYEYKDVLRNPSGSRRRHDRNGRRKSGHVLNEEFQAPNVDTERLTRKSRPGSGMFAKERTSRHIDWQGLPDFTFSKMGFLEKKRRHATSSLEDERTVKKCRKTLDHERSEFFAKPLGRENAPRSPETRRTQHCHQPTRTKSSISYNHLQSLDDAAYREPLSHQKPLDRDQIVVPESIEFQSPASNPFLNLVTSNALLEGVEAFAQREKIYYSLEELKYLARERDVMHTGDDPNLGRLNQSPCIVGQHHSPLPRSQILLHARDYPHNGSQIHHEGADGTSFLWPLEKSLISQHEEAMSRSQESFDLHAPPHWAQQSVRPKQRHLAPPEEIAGRSDICQPSPCRLSERRGSDKVFLDSGTECVQSLGVDAGPCQSRHPLASSVAFMAEDESFDCPQQSPDGRGLDEFDLQLLRTNTIDFAPPTKMVTFDRTCVVNSRHLTGRPGTPPSLLARSSNELLNHENHRRDERSRGRHWGYEPDRGCVQHGPGSGLGGAFPESPREKALAGFSRPRMMY